MRRISLKTWALTLAAADAGRGLVAATRTVATADVADAGRAGAPVDRAAGFRPDGVLFAADRQAATIYAIDLGAQATGGAPGAKDVTGIDTQIASMLGTDAKEVQITDLAVHPEDARTRSSRSCAGPGPTRSRRSSASTARARSRSSRSTA